MDLRALPQRDYYMVKNEIQGILFKDQMPPIYGSQTHWNTRPAPPPK